MALKAFQEIQEAEAKAELIVNKALEEQRNIIKEANVQAQREYEEIISSSKKKAEEIIRASMEKGRIQAESIIHQGEKDIEKLLSFSKDRIPDAINLITERIVRL